MGNRLSKIYTRTGDAGDTGMADGSRIDKDALLVHAIGEVDELSSQLALVAVHAPERFVEEVRGIQDKLFDVGAELTMDMEMLKQVTIDVLEQSLDEMNQNLAPLKEFILPGGGVAASHCHVARSTCRRVERTLVSLNKQKSLNPVLLAYINRLSDYLFVLARAISKQEGSEEIFWQSKKMKNL